MGALLVVLLALAGAFRAFHDCLTHAPAALAKWGPFWDARTSWQLKYKDYYATGTTPAFPGSTTLLVAFTDAWHLSNLLAWACADAAFLVAAFPAYRWWAVAAVAARRCAFEPLYSFLRK
jgi:hypothetical protein